MTTRVCDVCGDPRERRERRRLVWDSGLGGELVLAELCARCAGRTDQLLALYGGRGREAVRLTQEESLPAVQAAARRAGGVVVRGAIYVLIALTAFIVVTFVASRN